MKVWEIRGDWSMDHLQPGERPKPAPGPGQVLLRMRAASLNFRDLVVPKRGYGALTGTLPLIPVSDGVGIVEAVGEGVRRVGVGDRVCPLFMPYFHGGEPSTERLTRTLGGPIDGVMGERTRQAIRAYQRDRQMPVDGQVSQALVSSLAAN